MNNKPLISFKSEIVTRWIILQNVIIPTVLAIASAIGSAVLSSSIEGDLAIEGSKIQWVTINYLLGIITIVPIANFFADKYGYKRLYLIGITIFLLGTLGSAIARHFPLLAFSRLIEGMGAGVIFPVGLSIIAHYFPKEKLSLAINLYLGMSFGLGFAGGSFLAGFIGMYYPWSFFFFLMTPNCLIAIAILYLFQEESEPKERGGFDYAGFITFIACISFLLIALANGQLKSTNEGWRSPFILSCFGISLLGLISFIFVERKKSNPFIRLELFKNSLFSLGCITLFAVGMSIFSTPSYLARYMLEGLAYDKCMTGMMLISYGVAIGLFSIIANILTKKMTPFYVSLLGLIIITGSYFLQNQLTIQSGKWIITTILVLRGIGASLTLGPTTMQALKQIPPTLLSQASTLLTFFRQCGGTYGGTILGIVALRREIFHTQMFARTISPNNPGYKVVYDNVKNQVMQRAGGNDLLSSVRAEKVIVENVQTQSFIQSVNDAMVMFGYITIIIALILLIVHIRAKKKLRNHTELS
jgi:MFS transporter, DHA2 family, multidrug resistance protein